jgi:hypothetical protein
VLLSLAILLMSLVAIGRLVDMGTDTATHTQFQSRGNRLAASKLGEVQAGAISLTGSASGTFDGDGDPGWTWSVEPTAQGTPNLYQVTVRVSRDYKGKPFEVSLTQFMFDPNMQSTATSAETTSTSSSSSTTSGTTATGGTSP